MGIFTGLVFLVGIHLSNTKIQTINFDLNDLESSKLISLTLTYTCSKINVYSKVVCVEIFILNSFV